MKTYRANVGNWMHDESSIRRQIRLFPNSKRKTLGIPVESDNSVYASKIKIEDGNANVDQTPPK